MNTNDYIKSQYLELPEHLWSDLGVLLFAQFMKENDSDYQEIMEDIDFDDLHDSIVDSDDKFTKIQLNNSKALIINAFKQEIRSRVETIQCEEVDCE